MHQVIGGDKASLQMPLKAHVYAKKYGNEEARRKRRSDQHNSQRRSKVSTSINTEEATPRVKSLSKEQTDLKSRRVLMISLFGAASIALLSFLLIQGSRIAEERPSPMVVHCARGTMYVCVTRIPGSITSSIRVFFFSSKKKKMCGTRSIL